MLRVRRTSSNFHLEEVLRCRILLLLLFEYKGKPTPSSRVHFTYTRATLKLQKILKKVSSKDYSLSKVLHSFVFQNMFIQPENGRNLIRIIQQRKKPTFVTLNRNILHCKYSFTLPYLPKNVISFFLTKRSNSTI